MRYLSLIFLLLIIPAMTYGSTLITVDPATADSTDWKDATCNEDAATTNYGTSIELDVGDGGWGANKFFLFRYDGMTDIIPDGSSCDSAHICFVPYAFDGRDKTATLYPRVRRVLLDWVEAEVTPTIYSTGNSWYSLNADSLGYDVTDFLEQSSNICRSQVSAWGSSIDTATCGLDDTLFLALDPNTIDSMSSELWANYGWAINFDRDVTHALSVLFRVFSRDREMEYTKRPFMRIYYTADEAPTAAPQVIIIQ